MQYWLLAMLLLAASGYSHAQAGANTDEIWASNNFSPNQTGVNYTPETEIAYPQGLVKIPDRADKVIWVELKTGRLNLLERLGEKNYRVLKSIPISIGKLGYGKEVEGDKRTPVGVYRINSYIPDEDLTAFYGNGAYPVNYPNNWDKLQSRTGYGIWLHGLPKGVSQRPLLDSDGCVVIDNSSLTYLDDHISTGNTLVILGEEMHWVTEQSSYEPNDAILNTIESWISDWESLDASRYLANYHEDFSNFRLDLKSWSDYKTRINSRKSAIEIDISNLSVIAYPGEDNLFSVRFFQDYKSSNYNWAGWKELLWKMDENGTWKILFEGNG